MTDITTPALAALNIRVTTDIIVIAGQQREVVMFERGTNGFTLAKGMQTLREVRDSKASILASLIRRGIADSTDLYREHVAIADDALASGWC